MLCVTQFALHFALLYAWALTQWKTPKKKKDEKTSRKVNAVAQRKSIPSNTIARFRDVGRDSSPIQGDIIALPSMEGKKK